MKKFSLIIVSIITLSAFGQKPKELRPLNQFSFEVYNELKKDSDNVLFSPLSAYLALGILEKAAVGTTKQQLDELLRLDEKMTIKRVERGIDAMTSRYVPNGKMIVANACWVDQSVELKPEFKSLFRSSQNAGIETVNMKNPEAVVKKINSWANSKTEGTIPTIVSEGDISTYTRMFLCNSVYLNLPWLMKFKPRSTRVDQFTDENNEKCDLKFMFKQAYMDYAFSRKYHFVMKRLGDGGQQFCILVPKEGYTLKEIEEELTVKEIEQLMRRSYSQKVNLSLPKFGIEQNVDLNQFLKNRGLEQLYKKPDFSNMTDEELVLESISQKVKMDVNEKRLVAAAVTVIRMGVASAVAGINPDEPVNVDADHPFLFMITDSETNGIFFMGRYAKPSQADIDLTKMTE